MAKEGIKSRKKWVYIGFVIFLLLAITGVVLGFTYWPAKSSDIANSMYSQSIRKNGELKENFEIVKSYATEHQASFADNGKNAYSRELQSIEKIYNAVDNAIYFYENTIESAISGNIGRRDVKFIKSLLGDASSNLDKMANYILENKESMVNFTVILQSWESIQNYYKQILNDYNQIFAKLYEIYDGQELSGVYGNQMMSLSVKGMSTYFDIIYKSFYGEEADRDSKNALRISSDLLVFTKLYKSKVNYISESYTNNEYKNLAVKTGLLEEKTEGKLSLSYLIKNNYIYGSLALTEEQSIYADAAIRFLKGGAE